MSTDRPDVSALLRAQHAVADVLAGGAQPGDAFSALLPAIGETLGWTAGCVWEPAADGAARLARSRVWSAPGLDGASVPDTGDGLAAAALASRRPVWRADAICFPLLAADEPLGAMELFRPGGAEPDEELVETMSTLGRHIGQYLERCRAEAGLRRSDALMRAVLNAAFDAIVSMDTDGNITDVNPAAEELFGLSAQEMVGREVAATIIPPVLREPHRRGVREYVATGQTRVSGHPVELSAMRADGTVFPVEVAIRRLEIPGPPVFTGFIRDLTARRAAEAEVRLLADEQAALRRVATLVARGADPSAVFSAVTKEVAGLLGGRTANMIRYQADGTALVIGAWGREGALNIGLGATVPLDGDSAGPRILRTGAPVRIDAAVGAPVVLDGKLWGAVIVRSASGPFPPGAELRLQAFAALAAQALANADAREQLAASRARLVTAGVAERRRLERNLHDGAQQRLVSLALRLRVATKQLDTDPERAREELDLAADELARALSELREIARGLHPAVLTDHGLEAGIRSLCGRVPVPVDMDVALSDEPGEDVQAAAYYVVAEALTNVAKYAQASCARVEVRDRDGRVCIEVSDDGVGGADDLLGSGLRGLADRVEALGGRLAVESPRGYGTRIQADLPAEACAVEVTR
jgi:PAS domain S-box-containing protein